MLSLTVILTHDKTTKNTERFSLLEGENLGVTSIYIEKEVIEGEVPQRVTVTVQEA